MKTNLLFSSFLLSVLLTFGLSYSTQAQVIGSAPCATTVGSGCVGACGSPSTISYTPVMDTKMNVHATSSSLCGNSFALADVFVDGVFKGTVNLSGGGNLSFKAAQGSNVVVYAYISPFTTGGIQCVWLGEVYYELCTL